MHSPSLLLLLLPFLAAPASAQVPGALPEDGFDPERGLELREEGAFDGFTLFSPLRWTSTYLIEMDGTPVHSWPSEHRPGNSVYLLDDGTLLRCCRMENAVFSGGGQGGRLQLHAWDGEVLWDFPFSDGERMQHHDVEPLPNGNVLLIAWELRTREEAIAAGRDPEHLAEEGLWPDYVVEIEPVLPDGGKVVWEWHAWDHLIQDFDPTKANYGDVTAHPERIDVNGDHRDVPPMSAEERLRLEEIEREMAALGYTGEAEEAAAGDGQGDAGEGGAEAERRRRRIPGDWLHSNGVDVHPELDLIVLSVRRFHEIWVIDHSTTSAEAAGSSGGRWGYGGDLLYRWGNPRTYGAGTEADRKLFGQHDATFVEGPQDSGGALHVLVFNNGEGRPGGNFSSVDEIALPFDPERGFTGAQPEGSGPLPPEKPAWSYVAPDRESFFSSFISGAQRLPNGNTLVCSGAPGRLFEVTREGEVVWSYLNPYGSNAVDGGTPTGADPIGADPTGDPAPPLPVPSGAPQAARNPGAADPGAADDAPAPRRRQIPKGLFRGTRIPRDHPGLSGKDL